MKLYTRAGDTGRASTLTRQNIPKDSPVFAVLGTLDELTSAIGVAKQQAPQLESVLRQLQEELTAVCGELAADPYGLALLLGMGVDTLSASPRFVPGMKHMIRRLDAQTCMDMAHSVLMSTDVTASQRMLRERLQESLGSELAFHTTSIMTNS